MHTHMLARTLAHTRTHTHDAHAVIYYIFGTFVKKKKERKRVFGK